MRVYVLNTKRFITKTLGIEFRIRRTGELTTDYWGREEYDRYLGIKYYQNIGLSIDLWRWQISITFK